MESKLTMKKKEEIAKKMYKMHGENGKGELSDMHGQESGFGKGEKVTQSGKNNGYGKGQKPTQSNTNAPKGGSDFYKMGGPGSGKAGGMDTDMNGGKKEKNY